LRGGGIIKQKGKVNIAVKMMHVISAVSFILTGVFIVLLIVSQNDVVRQSYQSYLDYLVSAEYKVAHMNDKFSVFLVILFLYAFKAVFPVYLYPLSAVCTITSAVFPAYFSIPINLIGLGLLYTIKYFWGKKVGATAVQSILNKSETVAYLIQRDGKGNPWLLALFRLVPGIPINLVSQLYGAMGFRYKYYLILSFIGYAPLLISYTFIGRNVFNPFSAAFLLPFVLLFLLLGTSMLATSKIVEIQSKRRKIR